MSRWPVEKPPIDPHPPEINLEGAPPDPEAFDGPLNLFIALHGTATANNTANQTLANYTELHPSDPLPRQAPPPIEPAAEVRPISVGSSLPYQRKDALPANDIATRHIYRIKS
jgi:hypothetical protein